MSAPSAHLLVDACVAKSAADPARHATSTACLALTKKLADRKCPTGAAMTPALLAEWHEHASRYAVGWLANMESRGRVKRFDDRNVTDLRKAIGKVKDAGIRAALLKDIHISEAAILYALPIASRDGRQRRYLGDLAGAYPIAGNVQWLNPDEHEDWADWIDGSCADRDAYRCGA